MQTQPLRVAIVIDQNATLQVAGIIRGDVAEGARLLRAIRDPLETFLVEARLRAIQARAIDGALTDGQEASR
jgi:hypothetical protein